ncbi:hypothetical protein [Enterococcus italicus]|uniref:hypothetical protein n=1 Tax=Enterococcus italicus TaxID=246144 RepID=UPI002073EFE2|nr:hypothetical protein [Enterococcus italicus]
MVTAQHDITVNGIVYCKQGDKVEVVEQIGKYKHMRRTYTDKGKVEQVDFRVSLEVFYLFFA